MFPTECGWRAPRHDHILPIMQETLCEAAYSYESESIADYEERIGWDRCTIPAGCPYGQMTMAITPATQAMEKQSPSALES